MTKAKDFIPEEYQNPYGACPVCGQLLANDEEKLENLCENCQEK